MEIPLLQDIVIIFGISIVVLYLCHQARIPGIVGFLLTGVLIGPHGLGFVKSTHEVEILAEIGIVLLLFTIGIEFSFQKLLRVKKPVFIGGTLQVLATLALGAWIVWEMGLSINKSIFIGCLIALSSTAIVLRTFQEKAQIDSPHGRTVLAILIFQDLIIVPMIILTPLLAAGPETDLQSILILLGKGIVIVPIIILIARLMIPRALHQILRTGRQELFLLSVVMIGLSVAWLTSLVGLSLGLGAFLAGLIVSESEYSHHALEGILPFREVFSSFFFVSIGMLLDINAFLQNPGIILLIVVSILLMKTIIASGVSLALGSSLRVAILTGLSLSQVGEFSFILSKTGLTFDLIDVEIYQLFLAVSILTMAVTPFIIEYAPRLAHLVMKLPFPNRMKAGSYALSFTQAVDSLENLNDHLIIIGFGVNGRNLARAAKAANIPYAIIEMNPDTVQEEKAKGEPILYGDATHEAVLNHVAIKDARILVVAILDPTATGRITQIARRLNPALHIIVRTRFVQEIDPVLRLGANEVIPEEFETSVEIFTLVLMKYLVPEDRIEQFISEIRSENYQMFRNPFYKAKSIFDLRPHLANIEVHTLKIDEQSPFTGKTLGEIDLRRKYDITLLAIRRDSKILTNPASDISFQPGDLLILLGPLDKMKAIC